jgi:lysophospholipid acyltransferase (LPLAT)-like uncharacterized protein
MQRWLKSLKKSLQRRAATCAGFIGAGLLLLWRLSLTLQVKNDPRPALRAAKLPYVYALLHAHQLAAVMASDEAHLAAMVSRSADGDLLVPALRARNILPVRGSSRSRQRDKGGLAALHSLTQHVAAGHPAILAVDGPRGPRARVHRGVVALARATGATILPVVALSSKKWIVRRTWDRFQIPRPFAHVSLIFGPPFACPVDEEDNALCSRLSAALHQLETQFDPKEAETQHATYSAPA